MCVSCWYHGISILKQHEQLHQSHQNKLKVYSRNRVQSEHFRSSFPCQFLYTNLCRTNLRRNTISHPHPETFLDTEVEVYIDNMSCVQYFFQQLPVDLTQAPGDICTTGMTELRPSAIGSQMKMAWCGSAVTIGEFRRRPWMR